MTSSVVRALASTAGGYQGVLRMLLPISTRSVALAATPSSTNGSRIARNSSGNVSAPL
jgi:hypothetical protein